MIKDDLLIRELEARVLLDAASTATVDNVKQAADAAVATTGAGSADHDAGHDVLMSALQHVEGQKGGRERAAGGSETCHTR